MHMRTQRQRHHARMRNARWQECVAPLVDDDVTVFGDVGCNGARGASCVCVTHPKKQ